MKRFYICDIIGTGTVDDSYRPAVADFPCSWSGVVNSGPDGKPVTPWALVIVSKDSHADLLKDNRIKALPDFPLDGKVSAINTGTKTAMLAMLEARGIDTAFVGNTDGYREVVRGIGRKLVPDFDENAFDVN